MGYPRRANGLIGIILAPWLHGGWEHLLSNSLSFSMLGVGLFVLYPSMAEKILWTNFFLTGFGVWLFARESHHIGASGWVYSLAGFLFFSGIFRRDRRSLMISSIVLLFYASMLETIFPSAKATLEHISWESHLIGGLVGAFVAFSFRKDIPDTALAEESNLSNTIPSFSSKEGLTPLENKYVKYTYHSREKSVK